MAGKDVSNKLMMILRCDRKNGGIPPFGGKRICLLKRIKKFTFFRYLFIFKKTLLVSVSINSLEAPSLVDIISGNFTLSN